MWKLERELFQWAAHLSGILNQWFYSQSPNLLYLGLETLNFDFRLYNWILVIKVNIWCFELLSSDSENVNGLNITWKFIKMRILRKFKDLGSWTVTLTLKGGGFNFGWEYSYQNVGKLDYLLIWCSM